jgi:hypothetical protein
MQGAFVVRLGANGSEDCAELAGRVEEVDTGRTLKFRSEKELIEFLRRASCSPAEIQNALAEREKETTKNGKTGHSQN